MDFKSLVDNVAENTENTVANADAVVRATFEAIQAALEDGDTIRVPGFGSFSVSERAARKGRNPKTGETIDIAASNNAKFKAASALKGALNG